MMNDAAVVVSLLALAFQAGLGVGRFASGRTFRRAIWVAVAVAALAVCLSVATALAADNYPAPGWVVDVIDGDTIIVDSDLGIVRVRLRCVDCPEMASTRWPEQPGARQARDLVRHLVVGHWVALYGRGSSFGRAVRRVVLQDGRDLAEVLVANGWAWVDTRYCRGRRLLALQALAAKAKRGVWGLSDKPMPPWRWRRMPRK